jgi:hypothetical protein
MVERNSLLVVWLCCVVLYDSLHHDNEDVNVRKREMKHHDGWIVNLPAAAFFAAALAMMMMVN